MQEWLLWSHAWLLASVRLSVGLAMTPLFSAFSVPVMSRLIIVLALSGLVVPLALDGGGASLPPDGGALIQALGNELAIGLLIAVGVHAAFTALTVAGRVVDIQMGFSLGAVLDPVSKGHSAVIATGMSLLGVVAFFVSQAHHLLLAGVFRTFELLPLGQPLSMGGWFAVAHGAGAMFTLGLALASPVVVALLLADVVVAVVSRNLPQMNVLFLSIPIKVLLGLLVMSVAVRFMGPVIQQVLMLPLGLLDRLS